MEKTKTIEFHKVIQELRRDIFEYLELILRRLSKLRSLEERLDMIEDDITNIRGRIRKIEFAIEELSNNIKKAEEYKERIGYMPRGVGRIEEAISREVVRVPLRKTTLARKEIEERKKATSISQVTESDLMSQYAKLTQTEKQIIKLLIKHPELRGGTSIAKRIGKAREHACRLLKKLYEKGFLERDESVWPYAYRVPEKVKQIVMLEEQLE